MVPPVVSLPHHHPDCHVSTHYFSPFQRVLNLLITQHYIGFFNYTSEKQTCQIILIF